MKAHGANKTNNIVDKEIFQNIALKSNMLDIRDPLAT